MKMLFYIILLLCGLVSLVLFLRYRVKEGGVKALMLKGFTSVIFICCATLATFYAPDGKLGYCLLIVTGLIFGLLGDIWLDLKWVYPKDNDIYTFAGFLSFLIGHLFYITAMVRAYGMIEKPKQWLYLVIPLVIAVVMGIGIAALEKPMKMVYGKFKTITIMYSMVLAYMTFLSGSLFLKTRKTTLIVMFIGAVLFMVSDLILSGTFFGEGKRRPVDVITNHVSYYFGQFLIASSLMFLE